MRDLNDYKTRNKGNSIMLAVPKDFNVPNGVEVEAKLVEEWYSL